MNFFTPKQIANNYIETGISKVNLPTIKMLLLGILAGIFIAVAGISATTVAVSVTEASVAKFLGALVFPGGLIMVLIAGSELFTGNCLLIIPLLQKKITVFEMLKNWIIVYIGNFIGSILIALAIVYSNQISLFNNELAISVISTAATKCSLTFTDAFIRGICCNYLVCTAVWMSFAAKDIIGKAVGAYFPVMMFVLCGFEHSIANMYYISAGLFALNDPIYREAVILSNLDLSQLNWANFFTHNLIPVTIGNIIGGSICLGLVYWYVYIKEK